MKAPFKWRASVLLLAILLTTSTSCSLSKDREIAEQSVAQFHNEFNSEKYQVIYENGEQALRKAQSQSDVVAYFKTVHESMGEFKNSTRVGWSVNKFPMETIATLQYDAEFARGKAREQFTFVLSGDKAALRMYRISSPLMPSK